MIDFAEISIKTHCAWERYLLGGQRGCPRRLACCKFWVPPPTNAVCPHWTAIAPHQTVLPLCTHVLNFKMQAGTDPCGRRSCMSGGSPVCIIRCALILMSLMLVQTLGSVTAATRTNERVALVDFYAECVFWQLRCDHTRTSDAD